MYEQQLILTVRLIRRLITAKEFVLCCLLFLFFSSGIATANSLFDTNSEFKTSDNELDLSLDMNELYNKTTRPDFTGVWVLDTSASDDPNDILKKKDKNRSSDKRSGGSKRGSGRMGKRDGSRSKGKRGNRSNKMEQGSAQIASLLVQEFEIIHKEPLLRITSRKYEEQVVYTDFRGSSVSAMGGVNQLVSVAGWEGNTLVIETTRTDNQRLIQNFKLLVNPQRLERITELSIKNHDNKPVQIKQIYLLKNQTNLSNGDTSS